MAGLADYFNILQQLPDSIEPRQAPPAPVRAPATNMQPYLPTAQQAIQDIASQKPVKNNPMALRAMEMGNKPGTFESAAKKVGFGLNPEIAAGSLEDQLKFDISRVNAQMNPVNQVVQGGPNFTLRGSPTNVPNFEMRGPSQFPVPSTEVLSRDVARLPPTDVSSRPAWGNLRDSFYKYTAAGPSENFAGQMNKGYVPPSSSASAAPIVESGGGAFSRALPMLGKALGLAGAAAQGANLYRDASNPDNLLGRAVQQLRADERNAPPGAFVQRPQSDVTNTLLDLPAGFAGVLNTMFGKPNREMVNAVSALSKPMRQAPNQGPTLSEMTSSPPAAAASRSPAPTRASGPRPVRVADQAGWTTYDVSPGTPIGTVVGDRSGLTGSEERYNRALIREKELDNSILNEINQRLAIEMLPGNAPDTRLLRTLLSGRVSSSGQPLRPTVTKPMSASDMAGYEELRGIDADTQLGDAQATRAAELRAANPNMTEPQIAADPQMRRIYAQRQRLKDRLNALNKITTKKLPGVDQAVGDAIRAKLDEER